MKQVDVAVVGAGPAGIAAALAAAGAGAKTALIDEQGEVGGSLRWRIAPLTDLPDTFAELNGQPAVKIAAALAERVGASAIEVATRAVAWGWFEGNVLGVLAPDGAYELDAGAIVIATGSTDRMQPFPGATLPGVMTARALQIFLHQHRVFPGRTFAVIGSGADADEVASAIETAGATVACHVASVDDVQVSGAQRVERITCGETTGEVDCVVVALSRQPDPELALQALAENVLRPEAGGFVPRLSPDGETTVAGVYVAGDAAGIVRDAEAFAQGRLAGLAAAGAKAADLAQAREALAALRHG
jgi:thioredoxin reductase